MKASTSLADLFLELAMSDKLGKAINELSLPNIPTGTMGGHVWWKDLASCQGWRLQKHIIWGNCRILDPNNVRRAWGGEKALMNLFERIKNK